MATTTNYSWTTPDDTALVKDGAAAIRSLGTAIDTTVFNNAGAAIAKTLIDAEGDLIVGDAADAVQRLAIGSNGNVLTVDTTVDGKIKWAAPAGGGKVLQVVSATYATGANTTSSSYVDTGLTVNITPTSATSKIMVFAVISGAKISAPNNSTTALISFNLVRDSTQLTMSQFGFRNFTTNSVAASVHLWCNPSFSWLDSPSTTSATTYKVQYQADSGYTAIINDNGSSIITAMEIGA